MFFHDPPTLPLHYLALLHRSGFWVVPYFWPLRRVREIFYPVPLGPVPSFGFLPFDDFKCRVLVLGFCWSFLCLSRTKGALRLSSPLVHLPCPKVHAVLRLPFLSLLHTNVVPTRCLELEGFNRPAEGLFSELAGLFKGGPCPWSFPPSSPLCPWCGPFRSPRRIHDPF